MRKIVPLDAILIPETATRVFDGQIFDVYQWQQELFDGSRVTFERLKRPDTVLAVCIVDDKIVIVEDEQPGRGKKLKLPGGRVDPEDASLLTAVQREIREETGYEFANWRLIDVMQPENKIEWFVYIYVVSDMTHQRLAQQDGGERILCLPKTFSEVKRLVHDGAGMLKYSRDLFEKVENLEALRTLPEFYGQVVDR